MSAAMQHMIRQNAQKMQDTMADLYDWCGGIPARSPLPPSARAARAEPSPDVRYAGRRTWSRRMQSWVVQALG